MLSCGFCLVPGANEQGGQDLSLLPPCSLCSFIACPPAPGPTQLPFCFQHAPRTRFQHFVSNSVEPSRVRLFLQEQACAVFQKYCITIITDCVGVIFE